MTGAFHLFGLGTAQFETLILILIRVSSMLSFVPIFSAIQIPLLVRFGLGLALAFVIAQGVHVIAPLDLGGLTAAVFSQVFIGAAFGFVAFLIFTGIQFAGEVIDLQVGFGVVNVINPTTQQQVTIIGELELALATLIYLAVDAHHFLIEGMAGSFSLVPLPFVAIQPGFDADIVGFFTRVMYLVFQIAGPIAIALFVTNSGLALMARVAPQMNIFAVGFPLQILVGLTMLIVTMPLLGVVLPAVFEETPRELDAVLRHMAASP
jgi:flagellar biosynthesis protein FliR